MRMNVGSVWMAVNVRGITEKGCVFGRIRVRLDLEGMMDGMEWDGRKEEKSRGEEGEGNIDLRRFDS